jgi:trehalose 6-phosphate phosphatase
VPPDSQDLRHIAILLDVDGTILDIAPSPGEVHVPASLQRALAVLSERVGGALALVSGRALADVDRIFAPLRLPAIGGHGAELRSAAGSDAERRAAPLDAGLRAALERLAAAHPGTTIEDKGYSIALHYRLVPELERNLVREVQRACEPYRTIELLTGKAVIEVKQAGVNKGTAVRELMHHLPFRGRTPIFVGDDVTDEDAFAVMPEFGGRAISVGRAVPGISEVIASPVEVRRWLENLSECTVALP